MSTAEFVRTVSDLAYERKNSYEFAMERITKRIMEDAENGFYSSFISKSFFGDHERAIREELEAHGFFVSKASGMPSLFEVSWRM